MNYKLVTVTYNVWYFVYAVGYVYNVPLIQLMFPCIVTI